MIQETIPPDLNFTRKVLLSIHAESTVENFLTLGSASEKLFWGSLLNNALSSIVLICSNSSLTLTGSDDLHEKTTEYNKINAKAVMYEERSFDPISKN